MSIDPRNGAPKRPTLTPPVHPGMTPMQQQLKGMGHAIGSAPDASAANPLDPTAPGKRLTPPRASWGNPGGDWLAKQGARVVDEAIERAEPDHPAKLGRKS
jgi:hypothetical protein